MSNSMYDIIKEQNGKSFADAIRRRDSGIFDIPNLDKRLKYAGHRAEPIMDYLQWLKYERTIYELIREFVIFSDELIKKIVSRFCIKKYFDAYESNGYTLIGDYIYQYQETFHDIYYNEHSYVKNGQIYDIDKKSEIMLGGGLVLNVKQNKVIDISGLQQFSQEALAKAIHGKKLQIQNKPRGERDIIADDKRILTVKNVQVININMPNAAAIDFCGLDNLCGDLDFSGVQDLNLVACDLTRVKNLKLPKSAKWLALSGCKLPECELDLSGIEELELSGSDLSRVKKIIMPQNAKTLLVEDVIWPQHGSVSGNMQTKCHDIVLLNGLQKQRT